ncbi:MAG TPA: hypothetical protein VK177_10750 [Flavobacteriales bacterium]|nr:hypothetical protein [Flavobacteriales bacterium]
MKKNLILLFFLLVQVNTFAWSDTTNTKSEAFKNAEAVKKEEGKSHARFLPFYTAPFIILIIALAKRRRQRNQQNQN